MSEVVTGDVSGQGAADSERLAAPPEALPAVMIVAGKGGVGKTTVTAAMARGAFDAGLKVLIVDVEETPAWSRLLPPRTGLGAGEPELEIVHLRAQDLLEEYLEARRMGRIARRLKNSGVLEVVGTAAPGIEDLVVLGKIKQLERSRRWDLILVDAPAAGHAITMLTSPAGIAAAVENGPLRTQADEVLDFLGDPVRCMVMLVTLPEATPVNEAIETAYALEDRVGVQLGPVVVNRVDEPEPALMSANLNDLASRLEAAGLPHRAQLIAAGEFRRTRTREQGRQIARLAGELPLAQIHLPQLPTAELGRSEITELSRVTGAWIAGADRARSRGEQ
jgi:CO dehydrogenase nickel-insertion accessory protein CooC1